MIRARLGNVGLIAAVDVAFRNNRAQAVAGCVLVDKKLTTLEAVAATADVEFPYIPGLLAFRELPVILAALHKLPAIPDVILCDGHGYAHPRRFGIACHLGVLLDIPTIGCAKSRLCGRHEEPGNSKGDVVDVIDNGEVIGACVRTKEGTKPVYVSTGHRTTLEDSVRLTLALTAKYRLPEPLRLADKLSKR